MFHFFLFKILAIGNCICWVVRHGEIEKCTGYTNWYKEINRKKIVIKTGHCLWSSIDASNALNWMECGFISVKGTPSMKRLRNLSSVFNRINYHNLVFAQIKDDRYSEYILFTKKNGNLIDVIAVWYFSIKQLAKYIRSLQCLHMPSFKKKFTVSLLTCIELAFICLTFSLPTHTQLVSLLKSPLWIYLIRLCDILSIYSVQ